MRPDLFLLPLLFCSPLDAQDVPTSPVPEIHSPSDLSRPLAPRPMVLPTAVLEGPDTALAGDLVIVSWGKSTGDAFSLITPESLDGKLLINTTDKQLGFSTRVAADYTFMMIAVNSNLDIVHKSKTIRITSGIPPPVVPPITPPGPITPPITPPPVSGWDDIKQVSAAGAQAINDPTTARKLAESITDIVPVLAAAPNMTEAAKISSFEVERVLMLRTGDSLKKNWREQWRIPINNKLNEATRANRLLAPSDFAAAMQAAANGLQ